MFSATTGPRMIDLTHAYKMRATLMSSDCSMDCYETNHIASVGGCRRLEARLSAVGRQPANQCLCDKFILDTAGSVVVCTLLVGSRWDPGPDLGMPLSVEGMDHYLYELITDIPVERYVCTKVLWI